MFEAGKTYQRNKTILTITAANTQVALCKLDGKDTFVFQEYFKDWKEVKPKIVRWINFYSTAGRMCYDYSYLTKGEAENKAASSRIACIKVEFEEGEGLDKAT